MERFKKVLNPLVILLGVIIILIVKLEQSKQEIMKLEEREMVIIHKVDSAGVEMLGQITDKEIIEGRYTVEKEKLYTVEIPNPNTHAHTVLQKTEKGIILISVTNARWRGWWSSKLTESEIKQDAGKGNTEKKEEELAELQAKAQSATAAQMSTLADANKSVEEAAKADNSNTEDTATKNNTDKSEKTQESAGAAAEATDSVKNTDIKGETQVTVETPTPENAQNATQQAVYTPIDIRL
jgi:hypothetical protein